MGKMHQIEDLKTLISRLPKKLQTQIMQDVFEMDIRHFNVNSTAYDLDNKHFVELTVNIETKNRLYIVTYNELQGEAYVICNTLKDAVQLFIHISEGYREELRTTINEAERYKCKN
jgi:predicted lipid carrier protein YhbT